MAVFNEIVGLRALFSIYVVLTHANFLLMAFFSGSERQIAISRNFNFVFNYLGCQVDVFFMIAGFLLTWKLYDDNSNPVAQLTKWLLDRCVRMWPGVFLTAIVGIILGDVFLTPYSLSKVLFFQPASPSAEATISFTVAWSNSVDVWSGCLLILTLYALKRLNRFTFRSMSILCFVSLMPAIILFITSPENRILFMSSIHGRAGGLLINEARQAFIYDRYDVQIALLDNFGLFKTVNNMYLWPPSRWSPFFIGSALCLLIRERNCVDVDERKKIIMIKRLQSNYINWLCLIIAICLTALPVLVPIASRSAATSATYRIVPDFIITVLVRPFIAIGWSIILYWSLCIDHTIANIISWFLSLSIWSVPADVSYLVYMTHMRIGLEMLLRCFSDAFATPAKVSELLDSGEIEFLVLKLFAMTYFVSFVVAEISRRVFELPLQNLVLKPFENYVMGQPLLKTSVGFSHQTKLE